MPILRVFPRRTNATPLDDYVAIGAPGLFIPEDIGEIHISVTFTYDLEQAEILAEQWQRYGNVKIGGPATGMRGKEFVPGMYLKKGFVITSRGCPNHFWFCSVPKREGNIRELPITEGYKVLDDNLLACSEQHIRAVFDMLKRQKEKPEFLGGIEAKIVKDWHVQLFREAHAKKIYFAYDTPDDLEPLMNVAKLFKEGGYKLTPDTHGILYCYVLIGYPNYTFEAATQRLETVKNLGICPMAMLYRDFNGNVSEDWRKFQRQWARPAAIYSKNRIDPLSKIIKKGNS